MEVVGGFGAGDCLETKLSSLRRPGDALWCKNIVELIQKVEIDGVTYTIFQKMPFANLIVWGRSGSKQYHGSYSWDENDLGEDE